MLTYLALQLRIQVRGYGSPIEWAALYRWRRGGSLGWHLKSYFQREIPPIPDDLTVQQAWIQQQLTRIEGIDTRHQLTLHFWGAYRVVTYDDLTITIDSDSRIQRHLQSPVRPVCVLISQRRYLLIIGENNTTYFLRFNEANERVKLRVIPGPVLAAMPNDYYAFEITTPKGEFYVRKNGRVMPIPV